MPQVEGIQGRGQAGIFGGSINPLQVYMQQSAGRQKAQADLYERERKKRDDLIGDLRKFNPDKVWEPFYDEVNKYVQKNVKQFGMDALDRGIPVSRVDRELEARKGEANTLVNKINWLKSQHADIGKRIDSDEYLNPNYYHPKLNDIFFNGMIAKPVNDINTSQAENIFEDSKGYNLPKITSDFMKSLPEKINQHYTEYWDKLGQKYDIQDTNTKLGLEYKDGPDGKPSVVVDPRTGLPKINMTDDVYIQAIQNHYLNNVIKDNLGADATDAQKKDFLTGLLQGQDPASIKNRPQMGHKMDQSERWSIGGYSGRINPAMISDRFKNTQAVVEGFRPDILANTFSPYKDQKTEYVDSQGRKVASSKDGKYFGEDGKPVGEPSHIEVKYLVKQSEDPYARSRAMTEYKVNEEGISEQEHQKRHEKALASLDRPGVLTEKFNIKTVSGRRQWHEASNRMLDQYLPIQDRYGEDYTKYVRDQYGDNESKGSIADQMKKAIKKQ